LNTFWFDSPSKLARVYRQNASLCEYLSKIKIWNWIQSVKFKKNVVAVSGDLEQGCIDDWLWKPKERIGVKTKAD